MIMLGKIWGYLRSNHFAMMAVCCALPVFAILGFRLAGLDGWWVYPAAILLCVGSHAVMMLVGGDKKCH